MSAVIFDCQRISFFIFALSLVVYVADVISIAPSCCLRKSCRKVVWKLVGLRARKALLVIKVIKVRRDFLPRVIGQEETPTWGEVGVSRD
jgi:hypothetical protein